MADASYSITCPRCGKTRPIGRMGYDHFLAGRTKGHCPSCRAMRYEDPAVQAAVGTHFHKVWVGIRRRCEDVNDRNYPNWGGRGISVSARWHDFAAFYEDLFHLYQEGLTIERIDNDGNYETGNVRFATRLEQARNKRNNRFVTIDGRTQTIAEWLRETHISSSDLYAQLRAGATPEAVLAAGPQDRRIFLTYEGRTMTRLAWAKELGINAGTISQRLAKGWPMDKVLSRTDYRLPTPSK